MFGNEYKKNNSRFRSLGPVVKGEPRAKKRRNAEKDSHHFTTALFL
jgi:hypothetical protein